MRVERWKAKEVFSEIKEQSLETARFVMDHVVELAKAKCPIGKISREGKFVTANVTITKSWTPGKGKNKGITRTSTQTFIGKRWTGREPGQLKDTIRRVEKMSRPGNVWVKAGNYKIYWAHMVEYGTAKSDPHAFLRPTFNFAKINHKRLIEEGIKSLPEVKS